VSRRNVGINVREFLHFLKNDYFVYLRDFIIDGRALENFTVFLKTMVTFTSFEKNLFVD